MKGDMEMGLALKITPEIDEVEHQSLTIPEQARSLQITDGESYEKAGGFWKEIRTMRKKVADTFDPLVRQAHELHRDTLAKKNEIDKPLEEAERRVKSLMSTYDAEQERLRREEEERLRKQAEEEAERKRQEELAILEAEQKAEEERLLAAAAEMEANGNKAQAEELLQVAEERAEETAQAVAEIQAAPVHVAPVVVPKATPKLSGGPVYQERWYATVTDIKTLCKAVAEGKASPECVLPNMPVLNKLAVALKRSMNVPGVRADSKRV
jgi:hypothetical protein